MTELEISQRAARRLVIDAQLLGAERHGPDRRGILATVDRLMWLQLDPTSVVARSHYLVLWSRLGQYERDDVARLIYRDQRLFEWRAFVYPTRHLPFYRIAMRRNPKFWPRMTKWMRANQPLRREVLSRLRRDGALPTSAFDGREAVSWRSTGWTNARNASQMLEFLSAEGRVLVAGRSGQERLWDLTERCVPAKALVSSAAPVKLIRDATVRALRSLGTATPTQIQNMLPYAVRDSVGKVIESLERSDELVPARVTTTAGALKGRWYIHASDAEKIPALERSWSGRTTLLSPFDTLIRDRARTEALFGMRYRIEIYVPAAKRQYGYFAMPILHNDELIARIDPRVDREKGTFVVNAVHVEPDVKRERDTGRMVARALDDLAQFTGVSSVRIPTGAGLPGLR
ncbi:MAG TPA: crosslink repair DNA glycosylase YcaQ family protein [Candidatus Limnocylindria bacterium]|jgi:hypothetical protein|nr:crosslink repair DNA glycosylase YcaQ family protein [Candidatus Limnocylindria bacterium]